MTADTATDAGTPSRLPLLAAVGPLQFEVVQFEVVSPIVGARSLVGERS